MLARPNMRFLLMGRRRYLFEDNFNGGLNRWTITDTEGKISTSNSNLDFSGGKATPAWGDPALVSKQFWARLAGLTIEWQVTPGASTDYKTFGFTDGSLDPNAIEAHSIYLYAAGVVRIFAATAERVTPLTYSAAQVLWLRIVCKATGAYYYVSTDNRVTWKLIWVDSSVTTSPIYAFIESYNAALTASACRVYQGYARPAVYSATPAAPVPSLGAELLTDPGLENWASATDLTSWTESLAGTSTINREASVVQAGTYAARLDVDASNSVAVIGQQIILPTGNWLRLQWQDYLSGAGSSKTQVAGSDVLPYATPGQVWSLETRVNRTVSANPNIAFARGSAASQSVYIDAVSAKALTLSSLLTLAADPGTRYGVVDSAPTLTAGNPCGHWIWQDAAAPSNAVLAYQDGVSAYLEKLVAGTYTQLIKNTAAYGAAKGLRTVAVLDGSTPKVALYYDTGSGLVQQGTTQSITDSGFGTAVYAFSTLSANTPGAMAVHTGVGV